MVAKPFDPKMGRARRQAHGAWWALALASVLVCTAWGGQHGLGVVIGWVVALLALVAVLGGIVIGGALFAGWAVRQIRAELDAQRTSR